MFKVALSKEIHNRFVTVSRVVRANKTSRNVGEFYRGGSRDKASATVCNGIIRLSETVGNCFTETVIIHFLLGLKLLS